MFDKETHDNNDIFLEVDFIQLIQKRVQNANLLENILRQVHKLFIITDIFQDIPTSISNISIRNLAYSLFLNFNNNFLNYIHNKFLIVECW